MIIGHINFDGAIGDNSISTALTKPEKIDRIFRNKYVMINENAIADGKNFVGRIVNGPFFSPEEVGKSSAIAQATILRAEDLPSTPIYYAQEEIEVLGEYPNKKLKPTGTRPRPKSQVSELENDDVKNIVGSNGDMHLGDLIGYDDIPVSFDSNDKKVLPRNIGIFGTVGGGKSNTAQVLIEEALKQDYSVILFDVEGEYVEMDKPSEELRSIIEEKQMTPSGVSKMQVYYPNNADSPRDDAKKFSIRFSEFDYYILFELIKASEAQERGLSYLIDALEKERGNHSSPTGPMSKESKKEPLTIERAISKIDDLPNETVKSNTKGALRGKLSQIKRLQIFDQEKIDVIESNELLEKGKLSVIDVSSTTDNVKNIVIVDILNKIFKEKVENKNHTKTLIMIEEAHTFISKENRDKMEATIDLLKVIARRGRKRWLSLCFISQQPSHIPNEMFELSNTRIVHSLKSEPNIQAIKNTTGGVLEGLWKGVPNLGQGQAMIISPQFSHPVLTQIRPALSKRLLVD